MLATPRGKAILLGRAGAALTYLLRDDFTTDAAAPLASPRTAVPGPGVLTLVQTDGQLSTSAGNLAFPTQASAAWGDQGFYGAGQTRQAGRAFVASMTSSSETAVAWLTSTSLVYTAWDNGYKRGGNFVVGAVAITLGTSVTVFAAILRGTGAFLFGKVSGTWTLLWVAASGTTTPVYPGFSNFDGVGTIDFFRVLDLPAPFNTDYGLATQRLAGVRAALDTFVHEANCVLEYTQTTLPSASNSDFRFRRQDATNYWQVTINSTGALTLNEVVAGTPTQRATAGAVVSSGHRIVIVADGTTIRGYSNNVLRWTYSSASNFATATAGELTALGTTGAVSDVVSWPRTLGAVPAALLDLAIA